MEGLLACDHGCEDYNNTTGEFISPNIISKEILRLDIIRGVINLEFKEIDRMLLVLKVKGVLNDLGNIVLIIDIGLLSFGINIIDLL